MSEGAIRRSSPCKGCTDRCTACHDSCEKYKGWKADLVAMKRDLAKKKRTSSWNYAKQQRIWKSVRRDNSHVYKKFSS